MFHFSSMSAKTNNSKFQTGNVIIVSLAHFVHDVYTAFLAPILPLIIEKLGITYFLVGLLKVIETIPSLLNPFIGLLADRVRLRYLVIITPATTTIVMSLIGVAPVYTVLAVLMFLAGLSSTFFHVPSPVLIKKISGDKIGKGMSFFMVGGEVARTLGPIVILAAVSLFGLEGTYKLIPFGIITTTFLFFKFRKINVSENMKKENPAFNTLKKHLPLFIIIAGIMFFRASMKSALTYYLPTYLTESGHSLWLSGIALSAIQFAGIGGTLLGGTISDRIGRKTSLVIITSISPLLMWLFLLSDDQYKFIVLIAMGFFLFASSPIILALVNEIKSDRPAFINGIYMLINFTIAAICVVLLGYLIDQFGFDASYRITAFLAFGSLPFALMLKKIRL